MPILVFPSTIQEAVSLIQSSDTCILQFTLLEPKNDKVNLQHISSVVLVPTPSNCTDCLCYHTTRSDAGLFSCEFVTVDACILGDGVAYEF